MLTVTVALILGAILCPQVGAAPVPENEILTKTQSKAVLMQSNATLMLNIYLQYQGAPFSSLGFSFPSWQEKGLPTASLGYRTWRCLCPAERLLLARDAFLAIAEFLQLVLDDQLLLNSQAKDLLQLLDMARMGSEALINNLMTALENLGVHPPTTQPEPLSWTSTGANDFQKKVRGYVLCREYKDWLSRVAKDMEILKIARRAGEGEGHERRDCCRT